MNNLNNYEKFCGITLISLFVGFLFLIFVYPWIQYKNKPTHNVYIEWVVYTASGPINYHGTYKMRGEKFSPSYQSNRGSNTVCVCDKDAIVYVENQSICIYVGTNDVSVKTIKIVK